MAQGTLSIFDEAKLAIVNAVHDFDTDVFKVAFITTIPEVSDATPTLADYTESTPTTGNYSAGGFTMTGTLAEVSGTVTMDFTTNIAMIKHASNPTNVYAALIYNSSKSNQALGFVEIDASGADGTAGLISLDWGSSVFTLS
jgi:hypothetical protein